MNESSNTKVRIAHGRSANVAKTDKEDTSGGHGGERYEEKWNGEKVKKR